MALEKSAADRLVNEMREKNLREIKVLKQDIADMKAKLSHYSKNDPKFLEEQMKLRNLYKSGAEIWTENLTLMMSYCRDEYQIDRQKFCAQFDLPEDFEEIPESADGWKWFQSSKKAIQFYESFIVYLVSLIPQT